MLALALGLLALFATQLCVRVFVEIPELSKLETLADARAIARTQRALSREVNKMETTALDYATWDATYNVMAQGRQSPSFESYIKSDLGITALSDNRLNGMVLFDMDGVPVYALSRTDQAQEKIADPPVIPHATNVNLLARTRGSAGDMNVSNAGFALTDLGVICFAVAPILPTGGVPPAHGWFLTWRLVDARFVEEINRDLGQQIELIPIARVHNDPALLSRLLSLADSSARYRRHDKGAFLFTKIIDGNGSPVFLVRQKAAPRAFDDHWFTPSLIAAFGASALFLVLVAIYFSRRVIARIKTADAVMSEVASSGDYGKRLPVEGNDELDRMFSQFNNMFAFIQSRENDLVQVNRQLEELSHVDVVTGIANRRSLDGTLDRCWRQAARSGRPLAVLLVDVDYFKLYNDTYGHQKGDDALRQVAKALQDNLHRATDYVARYGGEEFCVVLTDTEPDSAIVVAESLLRAVRDLGIPHQTSRCARVLTVSIGVSTMRASADVIQMDLVREADQALYRAKHEGRNRVCPASTHPHASGQHSA